MDTHTSGKKPVPFQEIKLKTARYCAYQERSLCEVRKKLAEFDLPDRDMRGILDELIAENFIDEERFARTYAVGKFRSKRWGRLKIRLGLQQHEISERGISIGLNELDPQEYDETITLLIQKKERLLEEKDLFIKREKIAKFVISKGFEPDLVWDKMKQMMAG